MLGVRKDAQRRDLVDDTNVANCVALISITFVLWCVENYILVEGIGNDRASRIVH